MTDRRWADPLVDGTFPYSKGLMARMLMGTGLSHGRAYELACRIEDELGNGSEFESTAILDLAADVLSRDESEDAARRLRSLRALHETDLPLIILIGGATGTGKSTVATEIAHRLGITRVTSTDFVRQTMRAFFSSEVMPSIHVSSFEGRQRVRHADPAAALDHVVAGFIEQTRNVLGGVRAVLERAMTERHSVCLEGVHLVPGLVPREIGDAVVYHCVLAIRDPEQHASHFHIRDLSSGGRRPLLKYLNALPEIRQIQDHLMASAYETGVPVIENSTLDDAVESVIASLLGEVANRRWTSEATGYP